MITLEHEKWRFYSGDTVKFNDSSVQWCIETAHTAEDPEMAIFAATGVMKAVLDTEPDTRVDPDFMEAHTWASELLVAACSQAVDEASLEIPELILGLPPVSGVIDSTSTTATRKAIQPETSEAFITLIEEKLGSDDYLILGLATGGLITSAVTYLGLPGRSNAYYPLRFSLNKCKDDQPRLSQAEKDTIAGLAANRTVLVVDEDHNSGSTLGSATRYFADMVGAPAYGASPMSGRHPNWFQPVIVERGASYNRQRLSAS